MSHELLRERHLGRTSPLATSPVGLGCMGFSQGYGAADDAESVRVIHWALDLGVTLLDTAMSYGQGSNERLVGGALRSRSRQHASVATKFGIVRDEGGVRLDGRPEHVRRHCDASLARLGVDQIDLYYLHRVDPEVAVADTVAAMAELVEQGKVRHLGLSEVTAEQLEQASAVHPITAVQFEWSLMWRQPEQDIVPAARRLGVGMVAYSPLGRGLLSAALEPAGVDSSEFRRTDPRFHGEHLVANLAQVEALRRIADELGITPAQLSLAWLLAQGADVVPIPGTRHTGRVAENVAAAGVRLDPATLARIEASVPDAAWSGDRQSFAVPTTARPQPLPPGLG